LKERRSGFNIPFELLWISGLHDHVHRAIRADGGRRRSAEAVVIMVGTREI
jgi:hypothetical protein